MRNTDEKSLLAADAPRARLWSMSLFSLLALMAPYGTYGAVFSNGALIRSQGTPEVYIIENSIRRWVPDPDTFNAMGFSWSNIRDVATEDLSAYPEGDQLKDRRKIPDGALYRAADSPKVYVVEGGRRRWIPDPQTFSAREHRWEDISVVDPSFFKNVSEGAIAAKPASRYSLEVILRQTPKTPVEGDAVQFRFAAPGIPAAHRDAVSFETFLAGFDARWVSVRGEALRNITLKKGGDYVFYVRARSSDGRVSAKPARHAFTAGLSPRWKQVKISSAAYRETNPAREHVQISNAGKDSVSLENWSIEGSTKLNHRVPRAVDLPRFDAQDLETPVVLGPGERLTLLSGTSPVFSDGLRINKCFGYITRSTAFYPAISAKCPRVNSQSLPDLTQACRDYIQRLAICTVPQNITDTRITEDSVCLEYLRTHFSYAGCLADYQFDSDFYGAKEFRAYLGLSRDAWGNAHDKIILRDADGLAVDVYQY